MGGERVLHRSALRLRHRPAIKFISFVLYKVIDSLLIKVIDSLLIDTLLVRGTAWVTARVASAIRLLQTGDVQSYAAVMALAVLVRPVTR